MTAKVERAKKGIEKIRKYFEEKGFSENAQIAFLKEYNIDFFVHPLLNPYPNNPLLNLRDKFIKDIHILEQILDYIEGGFKACFSKQDRGYVLEILEEDEFKPLAKYLKECHNCLSQGLNFAGAIMLRTCLEIVVEPIGQQKHLNEKQYKSDEKQYKLHEKINIFLQKMDKIPQFQNLTPFKSNLKDLFTTIRESGNDVAHFKEDIEIIEKTLQNLEGTFKTFCFILEKTLFKNKIEQKREDEEQKELSSKLNPATLQIELKNQAPQASKIEYTPTEDDIPF
jgi:hypothetical protein